MKTRKTVSDLIHGYRPSVVLGDAHGQTWTLMTDRAGAETWYRGMGVVDVATVPADVRARGRAAVASVR